jgi:rhamnose transport system ATP-binding protein
MQTLAPSVVRSPGEPFVAIHDVDKRFSGAVALDDVTVEFRAGSIHALVGANGAGKSTLGKVLAGVYPIDGGEIVVDGQAVAFSTPADALKLGFAIMQQEIALAGKLTVLDNIFLGTELGRGGVVDRSAQREEFRALIARTGFAIDPDAYVDDLRVGEQQQVAVLWALARHARLIVMDETTASLDRTDAHRLLDTARTLAAEGITVVYVSHFLDEIFAIADTVTILANGRLVGTFEIGELTEDRMVELMIGGSIDAAFPSIAPAPAPGAAPALAVRSVTVPGVLEDITLDVAPGEILGIYGLVGSGRSEFAHVLAGAMKGYSGDIEVRGRPADLRSPLAAIRSGITLLPESRKDQGLFLGLSVASNASAASLGRFTNRLGFVRRRAERAEVDRVLTPMALRGGTRLDEEVGNFSGGNQQKVLFAKCILTRPAVLILDEPSRGVDIGAKRAIYDQINALAAEGVGVILISSEHAEVLHLCHRVVVFDKGRIADTFSHGAADENRLLTAALGVDALATGNLISHGGKESPK